MASNHVQIIALMLITCDAIFAESHDSNMTSTMTMSTTPSLSSVSPQSISTAASVQHQQMISGSVSRLTTTEQAMLSSSRLSTSIMEATSMLQSTSSADVTSVKPAERVGGASATGKYTVHLSVVSDARAATEQVEFIHWCRRSSHVTWCDVTRHWWADYACTHTL
jgi:hypothetical protein